jgi:hypothetical protein
MRPSGLEHRFNELATHVDRHRSDAASAAEDRAPAWAHCLVVREFGHLFEFTQAP